MKQAPEELSTEACRWSENRVALTEFDFEGEKVTVFVNKDGTYGWAFIRDGECIATYHKIQTKYD